MKRAGNLRPQMFARENLFNAAGKRSKLWIAGAQSGDTYLFAFSIRLRAYNISAASPLWQATACHWVFFPIPEQLRKLQGQGKSKKN